MQSIGYSLLWPPMELPPMEITGVEDRRHLHRLPKILSHQFLIKWLGWLQTRKPDNQFETMRHTIWSLFCMKLMCQLCSTTSSHLNLTLYEEYSNIIHQPSYCRIPDQPLQLASATPALLLQAGPHDTAGLYFTWNTLYLLHWTFPFQLEVQREEWSQRSKEHKQ